jgi:hypothetical protein
MKPTHRQYLVSLPIILAILFSTLGAIPVYAEEITPPINQTAEPFAENTPVDAAPTNPGELLQPTREVSPESIVETAAPTQAVVPEGTEPPAEEILDTLPEILGQVPEGTDIILLNSEGEQESLASSTASEILVQGDPIWCPEGATPGDATCTASYATFNELIAALTADAALGAGAHYTGAGVIWVADSYNGNDDEDIYIDGSSLSNISSSNLLIQGGWNDGTVDDGLSTLDVSMMISNWIGDVTINNIFINGELFSADGRGHGLIVDIDGDITLNNVEVSNIPLSPVADFNTAARVSSAGNIEVKDSVFNNNATGLGLEADSRSVSSSESITLENVTAIGNTLMGVYLNTCDSTSDGPCPGHASISVSGTSNIFSNNGLDGLQIIAGGATSISNTIATENNLNGISIFSAAGRTASTITVSNTTVQNNLGSAGLLIDQNADASVSLDELQSSLNMMGAQVNNFGTGAVNITGGNYSYNINTGLDVFTTGNIFLSGVHANNNFMGASLISTTTNLLDTIQVFNSEFANNEGTGLHIESGNNIDLGMVSTSNNKTNGAYLIAEKNISLTMIMANSNAQLAATSGNGLYAESLSGNITFNSISQFFGNTYGNGAYLITHGNGLISTSFLASPQFAENLIGLKAESENGDITLTYFVSMGNSLKGAYLVSSGTGNINLNSSYFSGDSQYGLYASTALGNISLVNVEQSGLNDPDDPALAVPTTVTGAALFAYSADSLIDISNSKFNNNIGDGLYVFSNGTVNLDANIVDENGTNGAQITNSYATKTCYHSSDTQTSVIVTEGQDVFSNNGEWGLLVNTGSAGSLTLDTGLVATQFINNVAGDYLLAISEIPPCPVDPADNTHKFDDSIQNFQGKSYKLVNVPFSGSNGIPQECSLYAGTLLQLPDGTSAKLPCPFDGSSSLQGLSIEGLPGQLDDLGQFDLGMLLGLNDESGSLIINPDGSITITMIIPETSRGRRHTVLFWDTTLNNGAGAWFQMPPYEKGSGYLLDATDGRMIFSGVQEQDGFITFIINFPGTFILVSN